MPPLKDLTGQRFGKLVVIKKDEALTKLRRRAYWICDCDCGTKHKSICGSHLISGAVVSCGCHGQSVGHLLLKDITGQTFGRLTVLERAEKPAGSTDRSAFWKCKCTCGNIVVVRGGDLKSGRTQSCGCYNKELLSNRYIDLTGQRFGKLIAIRKDTSFPGGNDRIHWICKCDCGNTISVYGAYLRNGDTKSCGCIIKEDLVGQKFGKLLVKKLEGTHNHRRFWECSCECGSTVILPTERLKSGATKSCGCIRADDIEGQIFGKLTVLYRDKTIPIGEPVHWICLCECGNLKSIATGSLKSGSTKSCGCLAQQGPYSEEVTAIDGSKSMLKENLIGSRFGRLEVIGYIGTRKSGATNKSKWLCKCDCGNERVISRDNLKSGSAISCGCFKAERNRERGLIDISGKRFGYWTAIELDESRTTYNGKHQYWICKCDCGTVRSIVGSTLRNGMSLSCGCMRIPKLEYYVYNYLHDNNYNFETQVKFDDLKGIGNKALSYDFGVYNKDRRLKYLIECQGIQHYAPVEAFGGKDQFELQQMHDELKREYAKSIDIELLEIPYTLTEEDIHVLIKGMDSLLSV